MKLPTYRFWLAASLLSISKSPPSIRWSFYIETTKEASSKFSSSAAMDSSTAGAMYGTSS